MFDVIVNFRSEFESHTLEFNRVINPTCTYAASLLHRLLCGIDEKPMDLRKLDRLLHQIRTSYIDEMIDAEETQGGEG